MTDERAEVVVVGVAMAVAFVCWAVVFALDTAAVYYPWVSW